VERHEMLLKLRALKLHGMAAAFDEVIDEGIKRSRTPFDVLGRLLAAEDSERHARSIRYQMTGAKFPEYRELATSTLPSRRSTSSRSARCTRAASPRKPATSSWSADRAPARAISGWRWPFKR